jgi:hypothetical protein
MKSKNIELDTDYIGGQGPLTESEEKALSDFFKMKKALKSKKANVTDPAKKQKQHA